MEFVTINGFEPNKLYTGPNATTSIELYKNAKPLKNIEDNQEVWTFCRRVSYDDQGYFKNKNHGYILLSGKIEVTEDGSRIVIIKKEESEKWSLPIDRESVRQLIYPEFVLAEKII